MRVLAVDDEKIMLDGLVQTLRRIERVSHVAAFTSPHQALAYLKTSPADVALLDINMSQMDGLALAKCVKEICPETYIVFVTGYSEYAVDAFKIKALGYLMKPTSQEDIETELDCIQKPLQQSTARIRAQTFGNFELFVDHQPVRFGRAKSKELLAYLVDRKGASASTRECFSILWEDKEYNLAQERYFQKIVSEMLATLKGVGAQHIIIKKRNSMAVDTAAFDCDYYQFLKQEMYAVNSFRGEYMAQYSWAEFVTGYLNTTEASFF